MKLAAIALDYDGTIARSDVLDPSVREAIAAARRQGILVLLATGRILDVLRRVAGELHFVDGVIAENGAVIHFPDSGRTTALAPRIPRAYLDELRRRGVPHTAGMSLVDADAAEGPRLLDAIRHLQLPLVLIFNGGRVMTLPQGISKATGLRTMLDTLRLSAHNTVAIGDAENDHELLRLAEIGVAVEWGCPSLKAAADLTLAGTGPPQVAAYIRELAAAGQIPQTMQPRRRLLLGYTDDGKEFSLAVRGRNVLITGDAKSGKSWVAGLLCEQLILHGYCVCIIDPEGDYGSLEGLPGVSVLGRDDPPPTPRELLRALRYPDRSLVIDLSHQAHEDKIAYIRGLLPALTVLRKRTGLPHRVLLDEAHYYLHGSQALQLLDLEQNGYTIVTYCASRLPPALLAATEVMIVTCESSPNEIEELCRCCANCAQPEDARWSMLSHLRVGQAVALPVTEEARGRLQLFTIAPRITPHVRHRQKYVDVPVGYERAFVFEAADPGFVRRVRTLRQFVDELEQRPLKQLLPYVARHDFSRWLRDVFGDRALADEVLALENRYEHGRTFEWLPEIVSAIRARYDLADGAVPSPALQAPA